MTAIQLTEKLKAYIISQIGSMAQNVPMVNFLKPLINRALDKNLGKVTKALDLISDDNGHIDVDGILSEMIQNISNTQPFAFNNSLLGDIEIGGGNIKLNIPLTDKRVVFSVADLEVFKNMITHKPQ